MIETGLSKELNPEGFTLDKLISKAIIHQVSFIENELNKTLTIYEDKTGRLEYYYPLTKMIIGFNFPLTDNYDEVSDKVIGILSQHYIKRIIACM